VVAKHRRSEGPSLAPAGARMNATEYWPEATVGHDRAVSATRPRAVHPASGLAGNRYPVSIDYNDAPGGRGWPAGPEAQSWQEWEEWQDGRDWGPPPELHPDHPSAPVPRVRLPADHPSGPMPVPRGPGSPGRPGSRGYAAPLPRGPGRTRSLGRHDSVTTTATVGYLSVHREVSAFQRQPGPGRHDPVGYQWESGHGVPESSGHRRRADPYEPRTGPAPEWFEDDSSPDEDPLWMAGQVLTLADDKAAMIAQEAQNDAVAIREAAQRDAAAIRETAQREAAELRARLDSMLGELGQVVAEYIAETLAGPGVPAAAPARTAAQPALAVSTLVPPAAKPARPDTKPATRPAGPAGPKTAPAKQRQKQGRQQHAMRIAKYGTAVLLAASLASGAAEIGLHGWKFFTFREAGQGQTTGGITDQQFLSKQTAAAQHAAAPKGRHHKTSHQTVTGTHG
jgi:hypothetical protein